MWDSRVLKSQSRIASFMDRLKSDPPGCMLLEGGSSLQRISLALYWAMCLNCRNDPGPCLTCGPCIQIMDKEFRDLHCLALGEKVKIGEIRELRTIYSQKPHFSWRVLVIPDAQSLRAEPANALLKSLEEPAPGNSFVLLAPQRESIFPTLVSRSFILTLGYQTSLSYDQELESTFCELTDFVNTGRGWLDRTPGGNRPDLVQSRKIISRCRQELITSRLNKDTGSLFHRLSPSGAYKVQSVLKHAEYCLSLNNIRADMVMEWLAVSLWKTVNRA